MSSISSNRRILTKGKDYANRRDKKFGVEELTFDKSSREDFLTGFHKRKLQRQKHAQEQIQEQERLARIEERRKIREERKKDFENQLQTFQETVRRINPDDSDSEVNHSGDEEEWNGFSNSSDGDNDQPSAHNNSQGNTEAKSTKPRGILKRKEVYHSAKPGETQPEESADEEETTVTVQTMENPVFSRTSDFDLEKMASANNVNLTKSEEVLEDSIKRAKSYAELCGVTKPTRPEKKKKKFRYLTKAERRDNLRKQKKKK
ncbi:Piso0_005069 [Millerozyma farinosa CBS 7064]|uniref:Piso0_005069 protein n=1 Tax=Pichia sorbitophila (strain ATCC MYA-4447 / BCRC 22081 / CBS 7064 / NBRC 10061 / NRRL Y-12695) TaxID=559304 RepID=G8Y169_PICSO|nr:Piso0_005069 [Millerozyma farinosa CBS 7064]